MSSESASRRVSKREIAFADGRSCDVRCLFVSIADKQLISRSGTMSLVYIRAAEAANEDVSLVRAAPRRFRRLIRRNGESPDSDKLWRVNEEFQKISTLSDVALR